jgi:hypothetical protein
MRRFTLLCALLAGCFHRSSPRPIEGAALGRVVVYRNGVAFYERHATAVDGRLVVRVPRERVDDFLKSLTVVDPATGKPLAVSIPRSEHDDGNGRDRYLTMTLEADRHAPTDVLLRYITDAPAWRPSYRVVVGDKGKLELEGWAIVDNLSGEDWKDVLVGVGASSALSFRYDLWSVHHVDRSLLQGDETFAIAPPTGVSPYAEHEEELATIDDGGDATVGAAPGTTRDDVGVSFSGSTALENQYYVDGANTEATPSAPAHAGGGAIQGVVTDKRSGEALAGVTVVAISKQSSQSQTAITDDRGYYKIADLPPGEYLVSFYYADLTVQASGVVVADGKASPVYEKLDPKQAAGEAIHVRAEAPMIEPTASIEGITPDKNFLKNVPVPGRTFEAALGAASGGKSDADRAVDELAKRKAADERLHAIASKVVASQRDVLVEAHGESAPDAAARAARLHDELVDDGVPAKRIHVTTKIGPAERRAVRVVAIAPSDAPAPASAPPAAHTPTSDAPVGESHFVADHPMTVPAGASAMVAMVHGPTDGGVVYLYDPISDRGDPRYAFKSVRLVNPTADTLEPGPMTVYGDGRFIGEGITEPVPPHAAVVVPFALDREIVIERKDDDQDHIARLVTAAHGTITAEVQHRRNARFTITSRLAEPTTVYLRHRLQSGWTLVEAPAKALEVGDSKLFEIHLGAGETKHVTIAEATPLERTLDLASDDALDLVKVYIDEPNASPALRAQIEALLATHRTAAALVDQIRTLRAELVDLQEREGELHAQLVTLRLAHAGGELLSTLRGKLAEISERVQKTTIAIVDAQQQLMLTRVKLGNQVAELHLTDAAELSKR